MTQLCDTSFRIVALNVDDGDSAIGRFLVPDGLASDPSLSQRRFILLATGTQHLIKCTPIKFFFPPHDWD
jgi:hypothetical protein